MRGTLVVADKLLHGLHVAIALFCVVGWMIPHTRLANWWLIVLIGASWFGLGAFFGFGYCVVTDLQWKVKRRLGEDPLPTSFIKYQLDRLTGRDHDPRHVDLVTQSAFYVSAAASYYVNFL